MTSRKRITIALIGLIALVVIGWFVREFATGREEPPRPLGAEMSIAGHPGVVVA